MGKKRNNGRPKFKCKNEAQRKAIRREYAKRAAKNKQLSENAPAQNSFKLPLKEGDHRWNIYRVSNTILNGKNDGDVHGALVLDEENDNVVLVGVTHSAKNGRRNNLHISNLRSDDLDESGNLRDSYLVKKLVVSLEKENGEEGVNVSALRKQINDLQFTTEEKEHILNELSHLSTAQERYKKFLKLAEEKKKSDT